MAILNALACPDAELSILIVDDPQIGELNKKYLDRHGPTNVIAFPMRTGQFNNIAPHLLGDVVISIETAEREGKSAGISMEERVIQLLVHGILHLLGYDHEKNQTQADKMEQKSNEILKLIKT
jgi:probable rRNA maturation factor